MTKLKSEQFETEIELTSGNPAIRKMYSVALLVAAVLALVFGAGVATGFADVDEGEHLAVLLGIVAIGLAVVVGLSLCAVKVWPKQPQEPLSRSTKRSRNLILVMFVMGVILMFLLGLNEPDLFSLHPNEPVPTYPALIAIVLWLIAAPIITLMWWRSTDEHDRASYAEGANIAGHAYIFVAPSWWVATRAGLLPEQHPMIVLLIVASIRSAAWIYRRYF